MAHELDQWTFFDFVDTGEMIERRSMEERNGRKGSHRFDEDFKANAVDLLISSGKSVRQVAADLGVSAYSLYEWRRQRMGGELKAAASRAIAPTPEEEIRRLRQQVAYLERQREILKKAIAICSKESWLSNGGLS